MLDLVKESIADYSTFIKEITGMVEKRMGEEYTSRIYKVTKNNNLVLDSLVLLKKDKNFAPNIYLLPYYEAYMQGSSMEELAERISTIYRHSEPAMDTQFSFLFEDVKDSIVYRLVNFDKNKTLLEKIPYIRYLDLAITFHCVVRDDADGIGSIRITNEHIKSWKVSLQTIYKMAVKNTNKLFPASIRSMEEVIQGMLYEDWRGNDKDLPDGELLFCLSGKQSNPKEHQMYILSNRKGINGAACLLYDNILTDFADRLHSDLFILPSSIHEVILVPYFKGISKEALLAMVKDVNNTQVACDEVLSDQVYCYSRSNRSITM